VFAGRVQLIRTRIANSREQKEKEGRAIDAAIVKYAPKKGAKPARPSELIDDQQQQHQPSNRPIIEFDTGKTSTVEGAPRIIVVDDEPQIASLFGSVLSKEGFRITKLFSNGRELVDYLARKKRRVGEETHDDDDDFLPDLVVLDYSMPMLDGVETAKILRALYPRIKIVLVTAYDLSEESGEVRFDGYIKKPTPIDQLLYRIVTVLAN